MHRVDDQVGCLVLDLMFRPWCPESSDKTTDATLCLARGRCSRCDAELSRAWHEGHVSRIALGVAGSSTLV